MNFKIEEETSKSGSGLDANSFEPQKDEKPATFLQFTDAIARNRIFIDIHSEARRGWQVNYAIPQ